LSITKAIGRGRTETQSKMFQASQIGKKRSASTQANAILNSVFVTPNGDKYSLVKVEQNGKSKIYVYEFSLSNKQEERIILGIIQGNSIRCQFKHLISCEDACEFISSIINLLN